MRLGLFLGSLVLALLLGVLALQTPSPRGTDAPATAFSAARAMVDVREIAQRPHPVGSADHDRVRAYLMGRLTELGMAPSLQIAPLSPNAVARLGKWGLDGDPNAIRAINIVGVLPGANAEPAPDNKAILLMAHYDTVKGSPGAADDTAGVAAILETVRALKARGPLQRPLVVLFTDAEELNLDGARGFFSDHPLRDRIGAVINLEARGGGGRAMMFETGPGNAETIALFTRAMRHADGGSTSNSLTVLAYEKMPNGTDFTISRQRSIPGVNIAFLGRADQYHTARSTPETLDQGSVQQMGSQALEAANALLHAKALPQTTQNRVYADVLGRVFITHALSTGWTLLALTALLLGFAFWGACHAAHITTLVANSRREVGVVMIRDLGRGMLEGVWLIATGLVLIQAVRLLAGPFSSGASSPDAYYVLLRRLPWIEAGASLAVAALCLAAVSARGIAGRRTLAVLIAVAAVIATVMGGFSPVIVVAALISIGLSLWTQTRPRTAWGGWLGLIAVVAVLAALVQAVAPQASFLFVWPALLAAVAAAACAVISATLSRPTALIPAAIATVIGGAWIITLSHLAFLGIGMDIPAVLVVMGLLVLILFRPLASVVPGRFLALAACVCLVLACAVSLYARAAAPMSEGRPLIEAATRAATSSSSV